MWKIEEIECFVNEFKNIFLREHFRVSAAKPIKQLYLPVILGF